MTDTALLDRIKAFTLTESRFFKLLDDSGAWVWSVRLMWIALPLVFRPGFVEATSGLSSLGGLALEILGWLVWFVGLVAVAVHSPVTLTLARVVTPTVTSSMLASVILKGLSLPVLLVAAYGFVLIFAVMLPAFGDPMVNGSAYGPERRMALRPPGYVLGAVPAIWLIGFSLWTTGLLFVISGWLVFGVPILLVAGAASAVAWRTLHQLSMRWLVFVPAGFVLHDRMVLTEPVLIPRKVVDMMGLAGYDGGDPFWQSADGKSKRVDATGGAAGMVVEVNTAADIPVTVRGRNHSREVKTRTIRFSPTLPGKALTEARIRGIKIGEPQRVDHNRPEPPPSGNKTDAV